MLFELMWKGKKEFLQVLFLLFILLTFIHLYYELCLCRNKWRGIDLICVLFVLAKPTLAIYDSQSWINYRK
jgi:hypothetical protein